MVSVRRGAFGLVTDGTDLSVWVLRSLCACRLLVLQD